MNRLQCDHTCDRNRDQVSLESYSQLIANGAGLGCPACAEIMRDATAMFIKRGQQRKRSRMLGISLDSVRIADMWCESREVFNNG